MPPQQPAPQAPPGFQLNALEQAYLDQVLDTWQVESGKVNTFQCSFERWEYNAAFGPGKDIPLNKDKGELSFQKPDKGSFQITEISTWQAAPVPPGQQPPQPAQGDWMKQPDAIGEHWVCDGKSVFEYRHDQKQLVERPIPPELQGQAIVDGPLPFLFGAEAAKLKAAVLDAGRAATEPESNLVRGAAEVSGPGGRLPRRARDSRSPTAVADTHAGPSARRQPARVYVRRGQRDDQQPVRELQPFFQRPRTPVGWKRVVEQCRSNKRPNRSSRRGERSGEDGQPISVPNDFVQSGNELIELFGA